MIQKSDDTGLAYGYMMIMLYFGMAVAIWVSWTAVYDSFLGTIINPYIVQGLVSLQTSNVTAWNVNFIRFAVPIFLLFGFVFAINWSIYKSGGGMATFSTFWWGFLTFIIFCVGGLVMGFWGGYLLDTVVEESNHLPYQNTPMAATMQTDINWFINLFYFICYLIPVIGAVIFGQSIVKRVRMSTYSYA